ncbi:uncharacterized protein LOC119318256 isoform X4 [Triticum dicoccoides]|uniref:uncharacterized protein LOC119318256 isoform X4 n=1 Tax=Triticum dicoccoides TaxID=85692 RepID=UPI000E7A6E14|nr:uncharacterized protein LOC119318256 isoform X4 [Triticum dicoccoides]
MDGRPRTPSTPHPCHGRSAPNSFDAAAMASYARSACGVGGLGELRRHLPPPPSPPTRTAGSRSPLLFRVCRQGGAAPDAGRSSSRGCGGAAPAAGRSSSRGCGGAAQSAGRSRLEAIAAGACVLFLPLVRVCRFLPLPAAGECGLFLLWEKARWGDGERVFALLGGMLGVRAGAPLVPN